MKVNGTQYRTIWVGDDGWRVNVIDQTQLPHNFKISTLETANDAARAISTMMVRGAPLIGATAAYGICLGMREDASDGGLDRVCELLEHTRPTAINLRWAIHEMRRVLRNIEGNFRVDTAYTHASNMCTADIETNQAIGRHGFGLLVKISDRKPMGKPINILTHCNAGWLATVDWGTATAPIYTAHNAGLLVHVWVDETRPRNQGAALTAFELSQHGVPHTVIADNAGGHLMQKGEVDLCIVGTDRTTAKGDVANKVGTYLKALAATDNDIPFYVALPSSTIDWSISDGLTEIPIEQRAIREVTHITGRNVDGSLATVQLTPDGTNAANYAFDVTPARLISGLITERGVSEASASGLQAVFPEHAPTTKAKGHKLGS